MNKFWNWVRNSDESRTLYLNGTIAEESWFDDDITPAAFKAELLAGEGDITVWINSPGGDCVAASQIYSMLMDYKGAVTVKIDGIAASAASVIAMAGTTVLMAPTALMMVHMPVYPPTMRSSLPAMRRRWTIIPGTFNLRTSGSL